MTDPEYTNAAPSHASVSEPGSIEEYLDTDAEKPNESETPEITESVATPKAAEASEPPESFHSATMSEITESAETPATAPSDADSGAGFPETFAFKGLLGKTPNKETWNLFDRAKKKKLVLRRFRRTIPGADRIAAHFEEDCSRLAELPPNPLLLRPAQHGLTDEWFWYTRDTSGTSKSLREWCSGGKMMRPFEVSKRFVPLCLLLRELHEAGIVHRNIKPDNIFLVGSEGALLADADVGHFLDPAVLGEDYSPELLGPSAFLAPEQRQPGSGPAPGPLADLWSLAACIAYAVTTQEPDKLDPKRLHEPIRDLILKALSEDPAERFASIDEFRDLLQQTGKAAKPTLFTEPSPSTSPEPPPVTQGTQASAVQTPSTPTATSAPAAASVTPPTSDSVHDSDILAGVVCPQCKAPVHTRHRLCPQCGRPYEEPCLSCNAVNPFWLKQCRGCGADLLVEKQRMLGNLKQQQQYVMKLRETCGHDKAMPILKMMSLVTHPDFVRYRDWAKAMIPIVRKERRDIKAYVDHVRAQAQTTFEAQKYDRVQKIIEQVPAPLIDDELRKMYVEAGECITEVESLIREIRNAIATKQYNTLLSCVQRYLELKANDPEARSLQEKIEKLTTVTTPGGMKLRRIPGGKFYMGSHESDEFIRNNERPQHRVSITRSFLISVNPVTQGDFQAIFEYNPSIATDQPRCPVDNVTWYGALEYCNLLSEREGFTPYYTLSSIKRRSSGMIERAQVAVAGGDGYRLPTEAEWEYSCRAGSITPWCFGDLVMDVGNYAWFFDNAHQETHPVGQKKPNAWGLFDMHGNVMEWCYDYYDEFYYQHLTTEEDPPGPEEGSTRVIRGGAWQFGAEATRSPYRNSYNPEQSSSIIGFRLVRAAPEDGM